MPILGRAEKAITDSRNSIQAAMVVAGIALVVASVALVIATRKA